MHILFYVFQINFNINYLEQKVFTAYEVRRPEVSRQTLNDLIPGAGWLDVHGEQINTYLFQMQR